MKKEYKKTWKPFFIILIIYLLLVCAVPLVGIRLDLKGQLLTKISLLITDLWLLTLMLVIYKGQYVYWINGGPDYSASLEAGEEKRKAYAGKHLKRFSVFLIPLELYLIISCFFDFSLCLDTVIFTVSVVFAAFSTVTIEFDS